MTLAARSHGSSDGPMTERPLERNAWPTGGLTEATTVPAVTLVTINRPGGAPADAGAAVAVPTGSDAGSTPSGGGPAGVATALEPSAFLAGATPAASVPAAEGVLGLPTPEAFQLDGSPPGAATGTAGPLKGVGPILATSPPSPADGITPEGSGEGFGSGAVFPADPPGTGWGGPVGQGNLAISDNDAISISVSIIHIGDVVDSVIYLGPNIALASALNIAPVEQVNWADAGGSGAGLDARNIGSIDNDAIAFAFAGTFIESVTDSIVVLGPTTAVADAENLSPVSQANLGYFAGLEQAAPGGISQLNGLFSDNDAIASAQAQVLIGAALGDADAGTPVAANPYPATLPSDLPDWDDAGNLPEVGLV